MNQIAQFQELAIKLLNDLWNSEKDDFAYKLSYKGAQPQKQYERRYYTTPYRYLLMSAIGAHQYIAKTGRNPFVFDLDRILERLQADLETMPLPDLGLFYWFASLRLTTISAVPLTVTQLQRIQSEYQQMGTMDLAFLCTGLQRLHAMGASRDPLTGPLVELKNRRYGVIFSADAARSRYAGFNNQVYPIFMLAQTETKDDLAPLCKNLLAFQRFDGAWPWQYDVQRGAVAGLYPVYTVHQDGMAIMALKALQQKLTLDLSGPIQRSFDYIFAHGLVNFDKGEIYRAVRIRNRRARQYNLTHRALSRCFEKLPWSLEINKEVRSYHLGWFLFANNLF